MPDDHRPVSCGCRAASERRQADGDRSGDANQLPRTRLDDKRFGCDLHRSRRGQGYPRRPDHAQQHPLGADRRGADADRGRIGSVEHSIGRRGTRRATTSGFSPIPGERRGVPRPSLPGRCPIRAAARTSRLAAGLDGRSARPRNRTRPRDHRRAVRHGHRSRPAVHRIHLGKQRTAQGGHAFARKRSGRGAIGAGGAMYHLRHPAVSADAVLLGRRLGQRDTVRAAGRCHPGDRRGAAARNHPASAGKRAGHAVPRLAGSGRSVGAARRPRRRRSLRATPGQSGRPAAAASNGPNPGRAPTCSA